MFKKYSWLIYVFIIAFLLPGNFICLWGLKIRKPVVTYIIPDKEDPANQFAIGNDRHLNAQSAFLQCVDFFNCRNTHFHRE